MHSKGLQKIIEIDPRLENEEFMCDKQRLSQVFVNLLSNALKFTYKGYIKIKIEKVDN
jgi:signal transduction histidine kinase